MIKKHIFAILATLLFIIFASGCNRNNMEKKLLSEQKLLKDSANNLTERIGGDMRKGYYDNAAAKKVQLGAVHARLIAIQSSIDSLANVK